MNPIEQLQAIQKAELESAFALSQTLFRGFEQMTQLQMQVMRDMAQHAAQAVESTLSAQDVQTLLNTQAQNAPQAGGEAAIAYVQKLAQIVSATQAEMAETMNSSLNRLQNSLQDSAKQGAGAMPAGAEPVQALFQSAMHFTNQAVEAMQSAQQQATRLMSDQVQSLATAAKKAPAPARKRSS
ncbi:MAG: phasin family protein [Thiomonas sp.]